MVEEFGGQITEWHQGGCVGVDLQVSQFLWVFTDARMHLYPAEVSDRWKADWWLHARTTFHGSMPPLKRNELIVDAVDWLWAFPQSQSTVDPGYGGTWHTIRYADKHCVNYDIITPDGVRHCYGTTQSP